MIEFITLSRSVDNANKLKQSIGLMMIQLHPWNLTVVDGKSFDLFSGFNHGAAQTSGEYLAFVHDDVQFLANPLLMVQPLKYLADPRCGFIGIAGSRTMPADGCWWGQNTNRDVLDNCRGIVAHPSEGEFGLRFNVWPPGVGHFGRALVVDGVLLMCHRRTFEKLGGFDTQTYKGFHFYDIDITFRAAVQEKLINLIAPIPLLHQSEGFVQADWDVNRQIFVRKFRHQLPARL